MHNNSTQTVPYKLICLALAAAFVASCSMFRGDRESSDTPERYDDAPIYDSTGALPGDRSGATYSDEDLRAE